MLKLIRFSHQIFNMKIHTLIVEFDTNSNARITIEASAVQNRQNRVHITRSRKDETKLDLVPGLQGDLDSGKKDLENLTHF